MWYNCSGQRDPAAYKTKDEIATPAGIDQDYNFLRGLERVLEKVETKLNESVNDNAESHHSGRMRGLEKKKDGFRKAEVALEKALGRSGVRIEKAPKGMARAKENATFFSKK